METQAALRILFLTFAIVCVFYNGVYGRASQEIDMILTTLNKPALKTIKSEDGDIIDCVDIYKQPAFDHPDLKNHKIQMEPSVEFVSKKTNSPKNNSKPVISQIWTKSGRCPAGTIPIRRVSRADIIRASSPSQFGRKTPHVYNFLDKAYQHKSNISLTAEKISKPHPKDRSEAVLLEVGRNYIGAISDINVWNPSGVQAGDYSSAQIWLLAGVVDVFETIEAGWVVNPQVFGDSRTRLFTYWTKDSYKKTGCFNLLCSGFVQTSTHYSLGATIYPVSTTSHKQYDITVAIFLDPNSGNWWMSTQDIIFGYWPGKLFRSINRRATAVQWGGEVHSRNVRQKPHTKTPMGSGAWASSLRGKACYHTNIRIKDYSMQIKHPEFLSESSDEYNCYSTKRHRYENETQPFFYFGGPGRNSRCL
ncbi:unnamed protein product [Arabis nemorensis]|uniref:Neprosin PEP catalytic domain-containing protein n=1 Tax=Arabis nemorensis TaxID=586526 RepID=A0A565CUF1_9BRAS|nr:unnamed protein product [Arabis nemorensis]